jgi:hydroxyacylglutathione hydrolase
VKELAPGVLQVAGFPPNAVNSYLVGDVLVDSGSRLERPFLLRQLRGHTVVAHALTHAHGDHQGNSRAVCTRLGVPFWVPRGELAMAEAGGRATYADMPHPLHPVPRLYSHLFPGPGQRADRALVEGDVVAGFTVLETPGHSLGHVSFWRESDRVLIVGDVFTNMNVSTFMPGLHEPKPYFTSDPAANRAALRRLAALRPALACVGHGPPLRDPDRLAAFAAGLPAG